MHTKREFTCFTDFLAAAAKRSTLTTRASRAERRDWNGGSSYEETERLAVEGWPEGAERVRALAACIHGVVGERVHRPETAYAVCGDVIDMGRFLVGEPECFMEFREGDDLTVGSKIVRIVVNIAASGGIGPDVIALRGAAVCALVEASELSGRRAEVIMTCGVTNGSSSYEVTVPVKESGQPLEMDRLSFMLCHAGVLRRFVFSLMETEGSALRRALGVPGCYGYPADTETTGAIVLGKAHWHEAAWRSVDGAQRWVLKQLEEQGVQLTEARGLAVALPG
ncbi:MAG: hypothetical protein M3Q85_13605 [Acidobacteriota bacterium]|nr:hypothetical protein [Acidobacteriota bacterium]